MLSNSTKQHTKSLPKSDQNFGYQRSLTNFSVFLVFLPLMSDENQSVQRRCNVLIILFFQVSQFYFFDIRMFLTSIEKQKPMQLSSKLFFQFSYNYHKKKHLWRVSLFISSWVNRGKLVFFSEIGVLVPQRVILFLVE